MKVRDNKWIGLSPLALATCLAAAGLQAEERSKAPQYQVEDCCSLCPAAHDASRYTTNYMKNFTTLIDAQDAWLFRTEEDLRTEFGTTAEGYRMLKQLRDAFKSRGVELVMVYQPTRGLVNRSKLKPEDRGRFNYDLALRNYRQALARFEQVGLSVPDLSPLADEQQEHPFYFRRDQHWTPYGAERTARLVAETVKRIPAFETIEKKEFVSQRIGLMGKTGTMQKVASQLCGTTYAPQYIDQFATEPKAESGSDELFGDSTPPQITLVGTSHSGPNYNFGGFLEEHIGADVLNVAFPGSGLEGSMLEYLGSEEFQNNPPKILIWEFSPLYDLASAKIHRQMMAMLDNGCEGKDALMSSRSTLKPGKNELMVNSRNMDLRNSSHQIDIRFADPSVKTLQATLWYMNGRHEDIKIEKPETSDTDGRFAFELRTDEDWASQNLLAVEVQGPEAGAAPQKVEAKICKRNVFPGAGQQTAQVGQ